MWNNERIQSWFSRESALKYRVIAGILPDAFVGRNRGRIRQEVGIHLVWLAMVTYYARGEEHLAPESLTHLIKILNRHDSDEGAKRDFQALLRYMEATEEPLTERSIYQMDCTPIADIFLERINLPRLSALRHPIKRYRYEAARSKLANTMHSELVSMLASFHLGRYMDMAPKVRSESTTLSATV